MEKKFKVLLVAGLLLRLLLAPMTQHPDVIDNLNWGRNLLSEGFFGFYRRDIPDAGPPNYPPLYYFVNFGNQAAYEAVKQILWKANLFIPAFPSKLYLWFESQSGNIFFNKLPAIVADIAIAYILYKLITYVKDSGKGLAAAALYLFLPPSWYLSAVWGQTDSLYLFFILAALYLLFKKRWNFMALSLLVSFLIKPTGIFTAPLFAYFYLKNFKGQRAFYLTVLSSAILFVAALPFLESLTLRATIDIYKNNIREVTGYLTANAFNIWSLFYGFDPVSDSTLIAGIKAYRWGELLYVIILFIVSFKLKTGNKRSVLLSFVLLSLGSYLFMTKMHERYYFLTYIFLTVAWGLSKKLKKILYVSAFVFSLNLYHFWWTPKAPFLVDLLSEDFIEKTLILMNLFIFAYILRHFINLAKEKSIITAG